MKSLRIMAAAAGIAAAGSVAALPATVSASTLPKT
jgi:hypothetical protein